MNFYTVLGLSTEANAAEVKQAFRRRVKELHPDLQLGRSESDRPPFSIHQVIEAYEVLSDQFRREEYDRVRHTAPRVSTFNYREWLQNRPDDESKAKLVFYDVLRERGAEAVELYLELTRQRTIDLEQLLGREDFMDCAFMLALEFERQEDEIQAIALYRRIAELEGQKPFFRHFFIEVEERLLALLVTKTLDLPPADLVLLLEEVAHLPFRSAAQGLFYAKQAEVYWEAGERWAARQSLSKAAKLSPRDKSVARLLMRFAPV